MDLGLQGRKALVTGGSRGIGRAVVELLAAEGCSVAFCARDPEGVERAAADLRAAGADIVAPGAVDVGDAEAYTAWLREAVEALGGLDVLVCNATGYAGAGEEAWRNGLEIDVLGLVRAVEVALPALEASDAAGVVALSSLVALDFFLPGAASYGALKAAVIHHVKTLAIEHGAKGIRVNTVAPGPLEFEDNVWARRAQEGHPLHERLREGSPFGRMGTNVEAANAIVFLASPAAGWITGANLVVDGGLSTRVDF